MWPDASDAFFPAAGPVWRLESYSKSEAAAAFLHFPRNPHIMMAMESALNPSLRNTWSRWLVPAALVLALAGWFYFAPEGALGKLDAVGYAICHRIDARSFHIGDRQLPLCARCTGEFNAAAVALIFQLITSRRRAGLPSRGILAALAVLFLAFALDGGNSYLYLLKQTSPGMLEKLPNLYIPNNILRLFTGSGMGIALAVVLYPLVNQTLWRRADPRPAMGWQQLGILSGVILICDLAILTESPLALYPAAYLSTVGVLALLTIVFSMAWITMTRQENSFEGLPQLWLPAAAGLTLALLMVMGIDLLRFRLTGTWGGFPGITG